MKLHKFEYEDKRIGWRLDPVEFGNLTLLVGVSGVGKTRILRSILALKQIAAGKSLRGVCWTVSFSATNGSSYTWSGEFDNAPGESSEELIEGLEELLDESERAKPKPRIVRELLTENGVEIVSRDVDGIRLKGQSTPKLSSFESVLKSLSEEDSIAPARTSFERILFSDQSTSVTSSRSVSWFDFEKLSKRYTSLQSIRESTVPTYSKLALTYQHAPDVFGQIKSRFISIFPHVVDVQMKSMKDAGMPAFFSDVPVLYIKESGVDEWIAQHNISSGMFRTFMHLSELFLSPEGTVILIDEFENSLGVNCIDVVTEDLLNESRSIQFIVTSHHPYVINNIGVEYWKIVSRHGSTVTTRSAADCSIGRSSHDAFMQLLNLETYKEGIEVG